MDIPKFFELAVKKGASDLHLVGGSVPSLRVEGELLKLSNEKIDNKDLASSFRKIVGEEIWNDFIKNKAVDFSKDFFNSRFRINLHFQEGKIGISARLIPARVPSPKEIGFNETIYKLTHLQDGLILVTGPSGAGKSTSLACMINIINQERRAHIITIEDPIEYLFEDKQSIIEQRELGRDTKSFAAALKYSLRQDPNVIMVGEMRDLETISAALTAAETGHLVLSTLHTSTAPETIERIVNIFPADKQQQILIQLASTLRAVISQQLLQTIDGHRVAAREIMINNSAISNLIRRNQIGQIYSVIQTSQDEGMITMNKSIDRLYRNGDISEDMAKNRKRDLSTKVMYY